MRASAAQRGALRLGMIGLSPGNGHPYSWSAIINGYDRRAMASCPFPAIPRYLGRQTFPAAALRGAAVTHIWTQDGSASEHIARAARIPNIVERPDAMIGQVDAVLLARDDAENHREHAAAFLRAGLPIFIDKPLSFTRHEALRLFDLARYPSQIFTCTALRYAREFCMTPRRRARIGRVQFVDAVVPKQWRTYSVHVIEPVLALFPEADRVLQYRRSGAAGVTELTVTWASGLYTRFTSTGTATAPIMITVHGEHASLPLIFRDAFFAFKTALAEFIASAKRRSCAIPRESTLKIVDLIEMGL